MRGDPGTRSRDRLNRVAPLLLLLPLALGYTFLDYWGYSRSFQQFGQSYVDLLAGRGPAPQQYRVGVLFAANAGSRLAGIPLRYSLTLIDFVALCSALFLLHRLLPKENGFGLSSPVEKALRYSIFLVGVQWYLGWGLWYQRPETMTTLLYVTAMFFLLSYGKGGTGAAARAAVGWVVLTLGQAFVRADVPAALNGIVLLAGVLGYWRRRGPAREGHPPCRGYRSTGLSAHPAWLIGAGAAGACAAIAVQYYLQFVRFPYASYGDTPVVMGLRNLQPAVLFPCVLCFAPYFATVWLAARGWKQLNFADRVLLLASAGYFGAFATLGSVGEVRIFLPFTIALTPVTVRLVSGLLSPAGDLAQGSYRSGDEWCA